MITKPMLAAKINSEKDVQFPVYATPKLDGIRCLVIDGHAVTRKFKPVPNKYIRAQIEKYCPNGFDGEIMSDECTFNELQSKVMSQEGEPRFSYNVFDYVATSIDTPYLERIADLVQYVKNHDIPFVKIIVPEIVSDEDMFMKMEELYLKAGYEGIIVRTESSPYKCGRSTVKQQWLLKLKRFVDSEAKVLGFKEGFHNKNVATVDELGHTKRSSHKENKILSGSLGKFEVKDIYDGSLFKIGTGQGLTHKLRQEIWYNQEKYLGKIIKYKYQDFGRKDLPRIPVFVGFRDPRDMS